MLLIVLMLALAIGTVGFTLSTCRPGNLLSFYALLLDSANTEELD
jgi:hypothetical protein